MHVDRESRTGSRRIAEALVVFSVAAIALFCAAFGFAHDPRPGYHSRIRDAILRGATQDFSEGTGIGGRSFRSCFEDRLRKALDAATIDRLAAIYRWQGRADAAVELNRLGAPQAARCGRRSWVPELIAAAGGLRGADRHSAVARLGVIYGPYLGIRCHAAGHRGCSKVGVDVVLGRPAARVEAVVGDHRIRLRTPGEHGGALGRDWVGTFAHAGLGKEGSPFHFHAPGPVYVDIEVRAAFPGGGSARAGFPHVLLAPGWG